jgi:hypothetical protein
VFHVSDARDEQFGETSQHLGQEHLALSLPFYHKFEQLHQRIGSFVKGCNAANPFW